MLAEKRVSGKIGGGKGRCRATGVKKAFLGATLGSLVCLESGSRRLETEAGVPRLRVLRARAGAVSR